MKRFKRGRARKLTKRSNAVLEGLKRRHAVSVLACALTRAIWEEGGSYEDAQATAEIAYASICMGLAACTYAEDRAFGKVVPFKRKASYFKG